MTVKELITQLSECDDDATICYMDEQGNTFPIENVSQFKKIVELD